MNAAACHAYPGCGDAMTRTLFAPSSRQPRLVVSKAMVNKPIFFDASGRRAARIKVVAWVVGIAALVILVGFVTSLALAPPVTGLDLPGRGVAATPTNVLKRAKKPGLLARAQRLAAAAQKRRLEDIARLRKAQSALPSRALPAILKPQDGRALAIGFYTNFQGLQDPAWPSLKRST